jgi:hypothetical protein
MVKKTISKLKKELGELEFLARISMKKMRAEYEEDIRYYKSIVENLKKEKGIE